MTPAPALAIERVGASELDRVMAVMDVAFDPAFGEAWTRGQCAGILAMPGVWMLIAQQDGEVLGFALSRVICDEAELLLLAVVPAARQRGVGRALVSRVAADARATGGARLHLEMRDGNPAAALYEMLGFVEVGRRRDYYRGRSGQRHDARTLSRDLAL